MCRVVVTIALVTLLLRSQAKAKESLGRHGTSADRASGAIG